MSNNENIELYLKELSEKYGDDQVILEKSTIAEELKKIPLQL